VLPLSQEAKCFPPERVPRARSFFMATEKQIEANRLNAQKSTGPRSVEGKAAASQNALKSGIDAESQVIRGEDPAALAALTGDYLAEFQPQAAAERALLDILIDSEWLLRRLRKAEAQLWEAEFAHLQRCSVPEKQSHGDALERGQQTFARLERRRDSIQRSYRRSLQDLRQLQGSRQESRPAPTVEPERHAAAPPPAASPVPTAPPAAPSAPAPQIGFVPESGALPHSAYYPKTSAQKEKETPRRNGPKSAAKRPKNAA